MIPMFKVFMSGKAPDVVKGVLESGMIGEGQEVEGFKQLLEKRFDCNNLVLLNSCTSALTLALRLANIKSGDEVISTPLTMVATNITIAHTGAKIVWADIDPKTLNISADNIESKINENTKAIVLTHVGGLPCDMKRINELCIPIIADCAHAFGTYYHGKHISHWADYSCFSFQAIKSLTVGDGGALVIKDPNKYELAEKLKWFGMSRRIPEGMTRLEHQMTADITDLGYKFHMNDIAAAIGIANLEGIDRVVEKHRQNAEVYYKDLNNLNNINLLSVPEDSIPSWWVFGILVENRNKFITTMTKKEIEVTPMWRRNDRYSIFKSLKSHLPNMDEIENKIVFIPVGWWLTLIDIREIIQEIYDYDMG